MRIHGDRMKKKVFIGVTIYLLGAFSTVVAFFMWAFTYNDPTPEWVKQTENKYECQQMQKRCYEIMR